MIDCNRYFDFLKLLVVMRDFVTFFVPFLQRIYHLVAMGFLCKNVFFI